MRVPGQPRGTPSSVYMETWGSGRSSAFSRVTRPVEKQRATPPGPAPTDRAAASGPGQGSPKHKLTRRCYRRLAREADGTETTAGAGALPFPRGCLLALRPWVPPNV